MLKRRTGVVFLPAICLGVAAVVALVAGAGALVAGILAAASGGIFLGVRLADVAARGWVNDLATATRAVVEGSAEALPAPATFGPLDAIASSINDIALELISANEAATTDRLTQVANRPTLLAFLFAEVERVTRYGRPLSIAFVDIDHFKAINDTYGHEAGDIVLQGVAKLFKESTRQSDADSAPGLSGCPPRAA